MGIRHCDSGVQSQKPDERVTYWDPAWVESYRSWPNMPLKGEHVVNVLCSVSSVEGLLCYSAR